MKNVTVIGAQWGDEGKGKIVDWLSEQADIVVRFQGGHNAGHTLTIDGIEYKLSLLPSGIVRDDKLSLIGNGVVIDPWALLDEIKNISAKGINISSEKLKISEHSILILPLHGELDREREKNRNNKLGTTGRGIGPAYEDKVARRAIRVIDLLNDSILKEKIEQLLSHHNILRNGLGLPLIDEQYLFNNLISIRNEIIPYIAPVWKILNESKNKKILFEGAQAIMLDVDHGTYPYVTSSNTVPAQASIGSGVGIKNIGEVLGIAKAYTTRVGMGPFPTELMDETGELLGSIGKEFGTVTGRKRRCGWFDSVMVKQAISIAGIDGLALTKLDVLDTLPEIKICVGYKCKKTENEYNYFSMNFDQDQIQPIYETIAGWQCSTKGARSWKDLPANAVKYIKRIEELVNCPIHILSTSPNREDVIVVKNPFEY